MARTVAAVLVGYAAIVGLVLLSFSGAYFLMGDRWSFRWDSYAVTTWRLVVNLVLSLLAAIGGGVVAARLGRSPRAVRCLMSLVLVVGYVLAFVAARSVDKRPYARDSATSVWEAMRNARQPFWVMLVNPPLGAFGVWLGGSLAGGRRARRSDEDRAAMGSAGFSLRHWRLRTGTLLIVVAVVAVPLALHFEQKRQKQRQYQLRHAMIAAAEKGETETLRELLKLNADVDSITNGRYPWTPLMEAAFRGHLDTARLLLHHGADVHHQDLDFFSAITLAAGEDHWEIVKLLAAHGADVREGDGYGTSAIDYAREAGRLDLVSYLEGVEAQLKAGSSQ